MSTDPTNPTPPELTAAARRAAHLIESAAYAIDEDTPEYPHDIFERIILREFAAILHDFIVVPGVGNVGPNEYAALTQAADELAKLLRQLDSLAAERIPTVDPRDREAPPYRATALRTAIVNALAAYRALSVTAPAAVSDRPLVEPVTNAEAIQEAWKQYCGGIAPPAGMTWPEVAADAHNDWLELAQAERIAGANAMKWAAYAIAADSTGNKLAAIRHLDAAEVIRTQDESRAVTDPAVEPLAQADDDTDDSDLAYEGWAQD